MVAGALFKRIEEEKGLAVDRAAGLRRPGGAFGQLEYPSPPGRARTNLDRNYILAAYMSSAT